MGSDDHERKQAIISGSLPPSSSTAAHTASSRPFLSFCEGLLEPLLAAQRLSSKQAILHAFWRSSGLLSSGAGESQQEELLALLRLLLPQADHRQNFHLKESKVASLYIESLAIPPHAPDAEAMVYWKNPSKNTLRTSTFSDTVYEVLLQRGWRTLSSPDATAMTVGEVHQVLDELASSAPSTAHDGRAGAGTSSVVMVSHQARRKIWDQLLQRMTALEHRWLVRVLLKDMKLGVKDTMILKSLHPQAPLWFASSSRLDVVIQSLRSVGGDTLTAGNHSSGSVAGGARSTLLAVFQPCKPMLAAPLNVKCLKKLFLEIEKASPSAAATSPLVVVEPKYDGERVLLHVSVQSPDSSSSSSVTCRYFTRNSTDYTSVFGPTFNPVVRQLLRCLHQLRESSTSHQQPLTDVILDGEMMVYDEQEHEYCPFGFSRTFSSSAAAAELAQRLEVWEQANHHSLTGSSVNPSSSAASSPPRMPASRHHYRYVVFDILYLNGAAVTHLPLGARRSLLQCWFFPTPPPSPLAAREPFSGDSSHHQSLRLLSTLSPLHIELVEQRPLSSLPDLIEALQTAVVVEKREGILVKNYHSHYGLDERKAEAWMKVKHDHLLQFADSLDLVVVGAYFGTRFGVKHLTHFLLGAWLERPAEGAEEAEGETMGQGDGPAELHESASPPRIGVESVEGRGRKRLRSSSQSSSPFCECEGQAESSETPKMATTEKMYHPSKIVHTVCKVGTGYTEEDLRQIQAHIMPHCFASPAPPAWLDGWMPVLGELIPDQYVHPSHSLVWEVVGAAFVPESRNYRVGFTLRFPRVVRLRFDKAPRDAATVAEVEAIRESTSEMLRLRFKVCQQNPALFLEQIGSHRRNWRREEHGGLSASGRAKQSADASLVLSRGAEVWSPGEGGLFERAEELLRQKHFLKGEKDDDEEGNVTAMVKGGEEDERLAASSTLFDGHECCLLSFRPDPAHPPPHRSHHLPATTAAGIPYPQTASQLEALLRRHGATVVCNPLPASTSIILADRLTDVKVEMWVKFCEEREKCKGSAANTAAARRHRQQERLTTDVLQWGWVMECLAAHRILPLAPRHALYASPVLQEKLRQLYDVYEDGYVEDCRDVMELKRSIEMAKKQLLLERGKAEDKASPDAKDEEEWEWCRVWQRVSQLRRRLLLRSQSLYEHRYKAVGYLPSGSSSGTPTPAFSSSYRQLLASREAVKESLDMWRKTELSSTPSLVHDEEKVEDHLAAADDTNRKGGTPSPIPYTHDDGDGGGGSPPSLSLPASLSISRSQSAPAVAKDALQLPETQDPMEGAPDDGLQQGKASPGDSSPHQGRGGSEDDAEAEAAPSYALQDNSGKAVHTTDTTALLTRSELLHLPAVLPSQWSREQHHTILLLAALQPDVASYVWDDETQRTTTASHRHHEQQYASSSPTHLVLPHGEVVEVLPEEATNE